MYPENDPDNIDHLNIFTVKYPFRIQDITRVQKNTMRSSCARGVGRCRGARGRGGGGRCHKVIFKIFKRIMST